MRDGGKWKCLSRGPGVLSLCVSLIVMPVPSMAEEPAAPAPETTSPEGLEIVSPTAAGERASEDGTPSSEPTSGGNLPRPESLSADQDPEGVPSLDVQEEGAPEEPAQKEVTGKVVIKGVGTPLEGAVVFVTGNRRLVTKTDKEGAFRLEVPADAGSISVRRPDFDELTVQLVDGDLAGGGTLYLERAASYREVGIIRARRKTEVSQQSLTRGELENIAGSGGDPVRGLQTLPSVLSTGPGSAQIVVRGGAPGDNKYYLDRIELPFVYHLGGLGAVVPLRVLSGVDLFAGGFSALYPDATAAVVLLKSESSVPERFSGQAEVSLIQSSVYLEGALFRPEEGAASSDDDSVGYRVGFRRSYLELFGPFFLEQLGEDLSVITLPQVTDYQFLLNGNHSRGTWQFYLLGAADRLALAAPTPLTDDASGQSEFRLFNYFEVMGFRYSLNFGSDLGLQIVPQQTFILIDQQFFDNKVKVKTARYSLDTSVAKGIGKEWLFVVGARPQWDIATTDVDAIQFPAGGFTPFFDPDTAPRSVEKRKRRTTSGSVYLDVLIEPTPSLALNPGVIYQRGVTTSQQEVDPRFAARYGLTPEHTLKGAVGVYSQRPNPAFDAPDYGNPELRLERANHYVLGWEYAFANNWNSDVQVYTKRLYQLVGTATANPADKYENNIEGRAYGAEFLIRKSPSGRYDGSVSYGYSVSERRDPVTGEWRLSNFDRTHSLTLVGKYKVTGRWTLGGKFEYLTGDLDSQLQGGQFNQNTGRYRPIPPANPGLLQTNDIRNPDFMELVLRSDYDIWFDTWTLGWFAELTLAPPGGNVVAARWNEDYSERELVRGLPLLPNLGIKASF